MYQIASRMAHIEPFHVMSLLAEAKALEAAGCDVIHMEIGEPDFPTPEPIVRAGIQALQRGNTRYTPAKGLPELREAIAAHYADRFDVSVAPENILVTPGASGALQLALGVIVNRDDEILLPDPTYPCNRHFVSMFEGRPKAIPVGPQQQFQPDVQLVKQYWSDKTRGLMLATPANPTGTLISAASMAAISQEVRRRNGVLLVDEIYQGLVYDAVDTTAYSVAPESFIINSFSKYFQMTGWRLGWLIAPTEYIEQTEKLAMNVFLSAPTPAQFAALSAFTDETREILELRRQELKQRRDFLLGSLRQIGLDIPAIPQGAFYIYADCSKVCDDSWQFAVGLLHRAHVAITPGIDFGRNQPSRYLRFAYTAPLPRLAEAMERLQKFIREPRC